MVRYMPIGIRIADRVELTIISESFKINKYYVLYYNRREIIFAVANN